MSRLPRMRSRRNWSLSSSNYDELMANHAICLLTYVADHPDEEQSYGSLEKATGIPKGTVWALTHWDHEMACQAGEPLYVWAENLGYDIRILNKDGAILQVSRRVYTPI